MTVENMAYGISIWVKLYKVQVPDSAKFSVSLKSRAFIDSFALQYKSISFAISDIRSEKKAIFPFFESFLYKKYQLGEKIQKRL